MVYGDEDVHRLDREFSVLSADEAGQVAWRCVMRLLPSGLRSMPHSLGMVLLRQALAASLFINGRVDARILQSTEDARALRNDECGKLFGRSQDKSVYVLFWAGDLSKALLQSDKGSASYVARALLAYGAMGVLSKGLFLLTDIQQIKNGIVDAWPQKDQFVLPSELPTDVEQAVRWVRGQAGTPLNPFWIDWYRSVLDGRPQNWPMLRDIASIDDALWRGAGEPLDREISRIAERHRLLDEVRRLKAELANARGMDAAMAHRGHNHPPELLPPEASELTGAVEDIATQLDQAEQELEKTRPSPSRLRQIGDDLIHVARVVLGYFGGLGDRVVKGAADEFGKALGKYAGAAFCLYLASQSPKILELGEALLRLAGLF